MITTIVLTGVTTLLVLYYIITRRENRYPPGPLAFPFIGNFPQLAAAGSLSKFSETSRRRYGDVFTFVFGGNKRVIISSYDTIHYILVKNADHSSDRSINSMTTDMKKVATDTPGIFWAPFPHWKTLRTFTIVTLREEGMGKTAMESRIVEEIEQYINHFVKPNLGKPFNMAVNISQASCNIISQLLYAKRFDYDDAHFNKMISSLDEAVVLNSKIAMLENLPFSKYFLRSSLAREQYLTHSVITPTLQQYIDEHKESIDREHPRDVTDRYLIHSEADGRHDSCFSDANATLFSVHLYVAGTETTSTALRWAMLFVCLYPEVKSKVQKEIDEHIGTDRSVAYKDRLRMPYTEAVLLETLRKGNIAPAALPHVTNKDLIVKGVLIPAGSDLLLNMYSVLNDETVFEEPDKFKPERYLTGDIALKKQRTIAFSIGRRACPGESLARMELFIFFVSFLQRFDVSLPANATVTEEPQEYLISAPKSYELVFTNRN